MPLIEKEFGKKRVIQTGIIFAVIWAICLYQTFVSPESLEGSRFRLGIIFTAYFGPLLFAGATCLEWLIAKKKSESNAENNGDQS